MSNESRIESYYDNQSDLELSFMQECEENYWVETLGYNPGF